MQFRTTNGYGTVSVENGTNRVIGSALADWTQVNAGLSYFSLIGDSAAVFDVQTTTPPEESVSGFWEVTLTANYDGPDVVVVAYVIHKDFTGAPWNLPLFGPGDLQRSQIWNRAMWIIHAQLGGSGSGGVPTVTDIATTPTADLSEGTIKATIKVVDGIKAIRWIMLEAEAPEAGDEPTMDDPNSRWRYVG